MFDSERKGTDTNDNTNNNKHFFEHVLYVMYNAMYLGNKPFSW